MLGTRLLVTALALPPVAFAAYLGGWPLLVVALAAVLLGMAELRDLLGLAELQIAWPLAFGAAVCLVLDSFLTTAHLAVPLLAPILVLLVLGSLVWALYLEVEPRQAVVVWAVTVAAPLYIGLPISLGLALRARDDTLGQVSLLGTLPTPRGAVWLLLALGLTWACDGAAYFVGRSLGRHPLHQRISPRKTLEGTAAGIATVTVISAIVGPSLGITWLAGALLGAACGVAAVFGDLAESLIKRASGAKDSGRLFPGHGGLLDRVDSMFFVIVMVYYGGELARALGAL